MKIKFISPLNSYNRADTTTTESEQEKALGQKLGGVKALWLYKRKINYIDRKLRNKEEMGFKPKQSTFLGTNPKRCKIWKKSGTGFCCETIKDRPGFTHSEAGRKMSKI